jgi:ketose-bisphosphate aldolase
MLVTLTEILEPSQREGYAVIAPDFLSITMLKHYLFIAEKYCTPIIASYPPLPIDRFRAFDSWVKKLRTLCDDSRVPVCLHLDHGKDVKTCLKAIKSGFTSIMIDASTSELERNINITGEVVQAAGKAGVSVEAEIGHVGSNKKNIEGKASVSDLTDPGEAGYFAEETGVDALAVSIGTLHGSYQGTPCIDFQRLANIKSSVNIPLVLHGGSGTGEENIKRSVEGGIRKINVFTDIIKPYLKATLSGFNPFRIGNASLSQRAVVETILKSYFEISGSLGTITS